MKELATLKDLRIETDGVTATYKLNRKAAREWGKILMIPKSEITEALFPKKKKRAAKRKKRRGR